MNSVDFFKDKFEVLHSKNKESKLGAISSKAFQSFSKLGIPTLRHEEWKYTRVGSLFGKDYEFPVLAGAEGVTREDIRPFLLPGNEEANQLVFVNGNYSPELSDIRSSGQIAVQPLKDAAENEYSGIVTEHLGHSSHYQKDGVNALNTAFSEGGVFVFIKEGKLVEHPVYIYNITDARKSNTFSQPRSLVYLSSNATVEMVEVYGTLGESESFTNGVMEIVVEIDARLDYYKIQHEASRNNSVNTTHIRQTGKSYTHTVTISLDGGIVRNNLNIVLDAAHCESHLYGLYLQHGQSHIDNHTVVDNVKPNCYSNQLYKGIMDGSSTGVFNGKIYVQPDAQKTNAYQSNKNVLLSEQASVNTKPQLEIFADDVKCSHGCTVGRLDEEALFYLQSRGIEEKNAKSLLLHAFADDILEKINLPHIRDYVDDLISKRLEFDL